VLEEAVSQEPPIGFGPADVLDRGQRARRRRRGTALAALVTGAGVTAAVVGLTGVSGGTAPGLARGQAGHQRLSLAALETAAARASTRSAVTGLTPHTARIKVDGIAAGRLAGLVQRDTGVRLSQANVSVLASGGPGGKHFFIDLGAGIAVKGHPYLNVQVTPAGSLITKTPTCAELSDAASGTGDGYYGPCDIRRLADGSILIVRSGGTKQGGFTMAQATLIRPDGSGIFAEDTNQAWMPPGKTTMLRHKLAKAEVKRGDKPPLPPVVRAQPPVGSGTLTGLVRELGALARS
jgi:hypothetical protein